MTENANSATNSTSDSTRDSTGDSTVGALLFRWRSYLPIGVVLGLFGGLYLLGPSPIATIRTWVWAGLLVSGVGLGLRVYAVAQAPPGTSGRHRRQFAAMLNTFGVYSVMRHPLYVGNVLVWIGVSMTSGWLGGTLASAAIGMLMFGLIVRHEDGFLRRKFGLEFGEWAAVTPAFWPRPGLWRPSRRSLRWDHAVASEYSTLHSVGLVALIFAALRGLRQSGGWTPSLAWWLLLIGNSAVYLGLRRWRALRRRSTEARASSEAPPQAL